MSVPATADELIALIRKSGLIDEAKLTGFLNNHQKDGLLRGPARPIADAMIREAVLTNFQAEQFMLGKWRGFTLGKYKLLERIGVGGMGQVFLCEHMFMRKRVAVKVLPPTKAEDPVSLGRFYREARVASGLDHPHIVHTFDIDQDGPLHFLVMEYVDGVTLLDITKKHGPLSVLRVCHYVRQACMGLEYAHQRGMIHRDIKPGNIILDRHGVARLLDMGLARFYRDEQDQLTLKYDDKNVLGTADYVAPEQTKDARKIDIRADIYGMGATFYFLLTGQPPFPVANVAEKLVAHQTKKPQPIRELRPEVPAGVGKIIDKMMAKNPADRYQTPQEVVEALEAWTATPIDLPPAEEMPTLSPAAIATHFSGTPVRAAAPGARDEAARTRTKSTAGLSLPDMSEAEFEKAATIPVPRTPPAAAKALSESVIDLVSPLGNRPASTLPKAPTRHDLIDLRPQAPVDKTPPPAARLAPPEEPPRPARPAAPEAPKMPPELARLTRSKTPGLPGGTRPPSVELPRKSMSDLKLPDLPRPVPAPLPKPPTLRRSSVPDLSLPADIRRPPVDAPRPAAPDPFRKSAVPHLPAADGRKPAATTIPPVYRAPTLMPFFDQPVVPSQPTILARLLRWVLMMTISSIIGAALGFGIWYFALLKR